MRREATRPPSAAAELALVGQWNEVCQVGSAVRFYPVWGRWNEFRETTMRAPAALLPGGQAVLWLSGMPGCVAAAHCEPAELAHQPGRPETRRQRRSRDRYRWYLNGPAEFMTFREFLACWGGSAAAGDTDAAR